MSAQHEHAIQASEAALKARDHVLMASVLTDQARSVGEHPRAEVRRLKLESRADVEMQLAKTWSSVAVGLEAAANAAILAAVPGWEYVKGIGWQSAPPAEPEPAPAPAEPFAWTEAQIAEMAGVHQAMDEFAARADTTPPGIRCARGVGLHQEPCVLAPGHRGQHRKTIPDLEAPCSPSDPSPPPAAPSVPEPATTSPSPQPVSASSSPMEPSAEPRRVPSAASGSPSPSADEQPLPKHTRLAPPAQPAAGPYVEPDLTGRCGARQTLGSRVCDLHPHPKSVAHEGAGPCDPRAKFWTAA